jgi:hypothetical protein
MSVPTVNEWLKVLEFFNIIKKERIGKRCTNRYWLVDRKQWRKDFEVILSSLSSGELKQFKDTTKAVLIHHLSSLKSNSKEINSKEINSKEIKKSNLQEFFLKGRIYDDLKAEFCLKYSPEIVEQEFESFIDYWTESSGRKQRYELQQIFDLRRRLQRWFKNHQEWSNQDKEIVL